MKDFGNEEYSGDCFELVGTMTGLSYRNAKDFVEIMRIIDHDLHLGLDDGHSRYRCCRCFRRASRHLWHRQ